MGTPPHHPTPPPPSFSVLVPTYNQAQYLGGALDSLLAQTDGDWEAVVVNDGSTDDTARVLEAYCRKDARFRAFHQENGGTASALNAALREARGEWLCWLSSDDLFEPRKLEIHREGIRREPGTRFFFSHWRELDDPTGKVTDPPLWRPLPEREWQVLEMLRCTYVHGNSICAHRDAWAKAGPFNERLRSGQDYDMWLRLLAVAPATFLPERTCITRCHPGQGTVLSHKTGFYDSARAAIEFLNRHPFPELVPAVDLADPKAALSAASRALDVAGGLLGFLYELGPHPALLFRILEWAWGALPAEVAGPVRALVQRRTSALAIQHRDTAFGLLWRAAAAATALPSRQFPYFAVSPGEIAQARHAELLAAGKTEEAEPLRAYLERTEGVSLPAAPLAPAGDTREFVFVCQKGISLSGPVQFGTTRAILESARYLRRAGRRVLLVGLAEEGLGLLEGIPFVGAPDERTVGRAVKALAPVDTLVGASRGDILRMESARRALVYHHGPHPVEGGFSAEALNRAGVPVICVSKHSRAAQIGFGVRADLAHAVPNGYDPRIFRATGREERAPHSLICVGAVADYKGTDVALRAFSLLRREFPDAVLHLYGGALSWRDCPDHLFEPGWLDEQGFPVWPAIERDLPGARYCGVASPAELAEALRSHSLLIMPSRAEETFGLVSLEAQACGCIPVLPRRGGFPETLRDGETGVLYEEHTPEGLAAVVTGLWRAGRPSPAEREATRAWVPTLFSWEKAGAEILRIAESVPPRSQPMESALYYLVWRCEQGRRALRRLRRMVRGKKP